MFTIIILIIILIATVYALFLKNRNSHLNELAKTLCGPPGLPIIGNGLSIFSNPTTLIPSLVETQKKYGSVTRYWIGPTLFVFLSNPSDIEIILRDTKNIKKSSTYDDIIGWLGQGLVTSTGQHWHTHRKIITPAFHFSILEKFVDVFNEKGKVLIKLLKKQAVKESFDIYPFVNLYAFDAILETSMGTHCNYQEERNSPYIKAIHGLTKLAHVRASSLILSLPYVYQLTKYGKEEKEILKFLRDYCEKMIKEKKENLKEIDTQKDSDDIGIKKRRAFLDLLLIGQKNGSGFTDEDILDEVNTFLFAGHDTISTAMGFSIYYLSKNQDIQEKAFQEVNDLYGTETDELTFQDLQNCQYIELIIKETARITPVVPFVSRLLETDLKLTNHTLPAGTDVNVFTYMVHHDPDIYPEPEKFDPERFTAENSRKRHPYSYVPFSAGPRNCIGQKYAMLELKASLVKIISNFRILPGDDIKSFETIIVMKSVNGINVKLESRNKI